MAVDDRSLLDDVGRETVLSRRGVTAGCSARLLWHESARHLKGTTQPTRLIISRQTVIRPISAVVNTFATSPLPAANEGPRAAHPSSQGRGFSMVYAVDGSYNNDVTYSVYGTHRPSTVHAVVYCGTRLAASPSADIYNT